MIKQILLSGLAIVCSLQTANADDSETVIEQRGVMGVRDANVFAPKYKERLKTYTEQIQMGLTKGWLNQQQADHFTGELERLRKLDADSAAQNYAEPGLSSLDKEFTKFNEEFSSTASAKPAAPAEQKPSESAAPPKSATPASKPLSKTKPATKHPRKTH